MGKDLYEKKSSSQIELLKWIGLVSMVADHVGVIFFPYSQEFRYFGRLAFPIFGFILIHNFIFYSTNKKKYMQRLFTLAIISEPIHFILFKHYYSGLNIFFEYTLVLAILYVYETMKTNMSLLKSNLFFIALIGIGIFLSSYTEYNIKGFLLLVSFYLVLMEVQYSIVLVVAFLIMLTPYSVLYILSTLSFLIILFFLKYFKRDLKREKLFFYIFYPGHLLFLLFLQSIF